jgi:hypothetical protein
MLDLGGNLDTGFNETVDKARAAVDALMDRQRESLQEFFVQIGTIFAGISTDIAALMSAYEFAAKARMDKLARAHAVALLSLQGKEPEPPTEAIAAPTRRDAPSKVVVVDTLLENIGGYDPDASKTEQSFPSSVIAPAGTEVTRADHLTVGNKINYFGRVAEVLSLSPDGHQIVAIVRYDDGDKFRDRLILFTNARVFRVVNAET